ncbi:MAG: hypothetical protein U9Q70_01255 [Chloroflexota bacterium]|nr:hypothetical protein [Chloroflexota bacterium]
MCSATSANTIYTVAPDRGPSLRQRMGRAGRERVQQHFSVEKMVQQTQSLYEQLLVEKGL